MKITPLFFVFSFLFLFTTCTALHAQKKQKGLVSITDEKGNVSTGKMKKEKKTGEWRTVNKKGALVSTENYVRGKREGKLVTFGVKGDTTGVSTYHNDTLNGPSYSITRWYLREEGNYVNGKKEGWWIKRDKGYYNTTDSSYYLHDQIQGTRKVYQGKALWQVEHYKDGLKHGGDTIYFYTTGRIHKTTSWNNGKQDGVYHEYSVQGEVLRKTMYRNDTIVQYDSVWVVDGKRQYLYEVTQYNNKGIKTYSANYSRGFLTVARYRGEDGLIDSVYRYDGNTVLYINYYEQGPMSDAMRERSYHQWLFYANGRRQSHGDMSGYSRTGKWTWFDSTGRVSKKIEYGPYSSPVTYTAYYPTGKVKITGKCSDVWLRDSIHVYTNAGKEMKAGTPQYKQTLTDHFKTEHEVRYREVEEVVQEVVMIGEATQDGDDGYDVIAPVTQQEEIVEESSDEVFMFAEQMPTFPGDSMQAWLQHNIKFPQVEKDQGKSGTVYVTFTVRKDGSVVDAKVVKGIPGAPGFSKEALRVVNAMPKWNPGKMNGRAVDVSMTIPVKFVL